VDLPEIEDHDFNLHIPWYVDCFEEEDEIELRPACDALMRAEANDDLAPTDPLSALFCPSHLLHPTKNRPVRSISVDP